MSWTVHVSVVVPAAKCWSAIDEELRRIGGMSDGSGMFFGPPRVRDVEWGGLTKVKAERLAERLKASGLDIESLIVEEE